MTSTTSTYVCSRHAQLVRVAKGDGEMAARVLERCSGVGCGRQGSDYAMQYLVPVPHWDAHVAWESRRPYGTCPYVPDGNDPLVTAPSAVNWDRAGRDATLGVGHCWTRTSCPAYASLYPPDCTCATT